MNKDDILGVIPARYASTRFPGKPLADIGGFSMIQRVYNQTSQVLSQVVVATDDQRIFDAVKAFGGKVVMTSEDHQSGTDRCTEALNKVEKESGKNYKVVVNIQGDEPFIHPEQIEKLTSCFHNADTEIATLVKPLKNSEELFDPNKPKVVLNKNAQALYFSRSPIPYFRNVPKNEWHEKHEYFIHIGLYAYRTDVLRDITMLPQGILEKAESLEQLRWLENGYIISTRKTEFESWSVDTPEDIENLKRKGIF
ncbi:3-deoxy-manno-octulosonate cytidylyltransferase [Marinilabilia salmonicolor]|jgi:3-deoxy-manno-octulosonate cytidylyltransferase (CMP-KDO synthetase)|uniref:3-deoxy-manno-octulosonate cytidylyltransferase n=1 Tax=Marinilabilia salmonicolor TaxID=989 RepID=A0A2T0XLM0_9BACT|nr:3-deoxy-manno-octulosonate cytidylyltransferase [Marinilabilia salmonicolor]PRY99826.1 3-deoxy-manno-octulosonate cytidylyltransferase (CMP-KDO synthetase) [Marinilabilia salmonicolor]RCW37377.1 3-deoxy-manno-octulosonate cytidylyltransferase (CMP-KDO synthetase) [Marinilabilia salmonicolor]